jgi:hypothetical protein
MHKRAVVLDPPSAGLEELVERRRRSGLDRFDEVWQGVLHIVPAPVIVDPATRRIAWLALGGGEYRPCERSGLIACGAAELAAGLEWPDLDPPSAG